MNTFLSESLVEGVHRLALGLEPLDGTRPNRIARPLTIALDGVPTLWRERPAWADADPAAGLPRLSRRGSGRYTIVYERGTATPVQVRLVPRDRRYVARRMVFAIPTEAAVRAAEPLGSVSAALRTWRPRLFPGAAYDVSETATGFRGRVVHGGAPVRWTRVEAKLNGGATIGVAHGDDRGEFLLLLGPNRTNVADLDPLTVTLRVQAADPLPAVDPGDPLGDVTPEPTSGPGVDTARVVAGLDPPPGYALIAERPGVPVRFARITSLQPFDIP